MIHANDSCQKGVLLFSGKVPMNFIVVITVTPAYQHSEIIYPGRTVLCLIVDPM